jgi:chemotaxis protein MotC
MPIAPLSSTKGRLGVPRRSSATPLRRIATRLGVTLGVPALTIALSFAARAESPRLAPYELVRSLEVLQNEASDGNATAYATRPKLVGQIAEGFLAADARLWHDERNARALAIYVLSGGQPGVVRKIIALGQLPKSDENLMLGSLAYSEGRMGEAKELLKDIDPQSLPASLGGQLALIQSTLLMGDDRERAVTLLGVARLLMPGTLVEDVALRREILAMAERHDVDKFMSLSDQYARRFRRSVYADNFWQSFAVAAAKMTPAIDAKAQQRLGLLVEMLGVDGQRNTYLSIAEISAICGNVSLARFAAERAASLSQEGSLEKARARLYGAAAMIVTDDYDAGMQALESIAKTQLPSRDEQLRRGVLAVAREVRKPAQPVAPSDPDTQLAAGPMAPQIAVTVATINLAQRRAVDTDELLKSSP